MVPMNQPVSNYSNPLGNQPMYITRPELSNVSQSNGTQVAKGKDVTLASNLPQNFVVPKDERIQRLQQNYDDKSLKKMGVIDCQTCANRTYQDDSNDPGVSFKAPTRLSPSQAATAVAAHEQEHVTNERANAERDDREIVSQSVQIFMSICSECGISYVSGGLTKTTTKEATKNPATEAYQLISEAGKSRSPQGNLLDFKV
jgi:hypothetical protein